MGTCTNCGRTYKPLRRGRCSTCARFLDRTGSERPYGAEDGRKAGATRGDAHPAWRGDAARPETKRARAQRRYALVACEACGAPATDRHHRNGDTGNNEPSNVARLCRRCHMAADGRLATFLSTSASLRGPQPPKPCANCGRPAKPLRRGLCHACNEYQRRQGKARPY